MEKDIDRHCGNCVFFKFEDIDGDGICVKHYNDDQACANCSNETCRYFISKEDMLGCYKRLLELEYLLQRKMKSPYGFSVSFAINYIKAFNKL